MKRSRLTSYTSLRPDVNSLIAGRANRILDVGCSNGANGEYLLSQGIAREVVGIEISETLGAEATTRINEVIVGNIETIDLQAEIGRRTFDYIVCADVLEHVLDSERVLYRLRRFLHSDGRLIISLPNIAHIDVFIHLFVRGEWPRNSRGIFDSTHIRFFTKKSAIGMIQGANLEILRVNRNYRRRDRLGSKFVTCPTEWLLSCVFKDLYTFQYLFLCRKNSLRNAQNAIPE